MLEAHADPNAKNRYGWTALHYAAHQGNKEIVDILVKAGASVDATDDQHRTPPNYSIDDLHDEVTLRLLNSGVNPSTKNILAWTPLHDAAKYGLEKLAKMLLDKNADVNSKDRDGKTPLHVACIYRHAKILQWLLDKGADQAIKDGKGYIPYNYVSQMHGGWGEGTTILLEDLRREAERQRDESSVGRH